MINYDKRKMYKKKCMKNIFSLRNEKENCGFISPTEQLKKRVHVRVDKMVKKVYRRDARVT